MEKTKECEIVEDLLFSYIDDVLNNESNKLVENHLKNCTKCKTKLEEIKQEINENEKNEKKEIDYLKKLRKKTRIKAIVLAISFIIILLFIIFLYKFMIINNLVNNSVNTLKTNNFYKETIKITGNNKTSVYKIFYKDGKYKTVSEVYSTDGIRVENVSFGEVNSDKITYVDYIKNKVRILQGEHAKYLNNENNIKQNYFKSENEYFTIKLGQVFSKKILKDNYDYVEEYYIFKNNFGNNQRWETWIDKETGLQIREIYREGYKENFPQSVVTKSINDIVIEYRYNFDIVTEKDVEPIDISGFEIEYDKNN